MNHRFSKGVALITAMLVVSLASVLAVSLVDHLNFDTQRSSNLFRLDQAQQFNRASADISRGLLMLDRNEANDYDDLADLELFNSQMASFPIEGGSVATSIADLTACFNLNNLASQDMARYQNQYRRLLGQLGVNSAQQAILVDSLIDWVDSDDQSRDYGAEYDFYLGQQPAYRTANDLLTSVSELRLIRGYNNEVIEQIREHVCVLPSSSSTININTASREVIESIDGLSGQGDNVIKQREDATFESASEFQTYVTQTLQINQFNNEGIQAYSEYFLLRSETTLGNSSTAMYSIIYRNQSNGRSNIIRQTRGEL